MIIDLILDRAAGDRYDPREFYYEVMDYGAIWPEYAHPISRAMDEGTEDDVRRALCDYVTANGYNPDICGYIRTVRWL